MRGEIKLEAFLSSYYYVQSERKIAQDMKENKTRMCAPGWEEDLVN